jgi:hypothetical protein
MASDCHRGLASRYYAAWSLQASGALRKCLGKVRQLLRCHARFSHDRVRYELGVEACLLRGARDRFQHYPVVADDVMLHEA